MMEHDQQHKEAAQRQDRADAEGIFIKSAAQSALSLKEQERAQREEYQDHIV